MADDNKFYIVRGAVMRCDKGSHGRRINLPVSHGSYVNGRPMMNKADRVEGKNISYFGVCSGNCESSGDDIYLVGEDGKTASGKKCCMKILKDWIKVKEDTLVEGKAALTTESVLICAYGGKIKFVTNGQEVK